MPTLSSVLTDYHALSKVEQNAFLSSVLSSSPVGMNLKEYLEAKRFAKGRVCPHCGSVHVVRNGKRPDGTQRYLCGDCKKGFVSSTKSIVEKSHKPLVVWDKFFECMMSGDTLYLCSVKCGISKNTAFAWRHKVLDALRSNYENIQLDGIVEADETFFSVSYKGNHTGSTTFVMPRAPHRGGRAVHKRGLSNDKVCVPCAVDLTGTAYAKVSNLARVKIAGLHAVLDNKITENSTLVTDKASAYRQFATDNSLNLKQLKAGKPMVKGIYTIQHINSYHSQLKKFMKKFNSVATKYLNNYLIWNIMMVYAQRDFKNNKAKVMAVALSSVYTEYNKDIGKRDNLPILA